MPNCTNEDMQNAIQEVRNGFSDYEAASRNGVPRQPLRDRIADVLN